MSQAPLSSSSFLNASFDRSRSRSGSLMRTSSQPTQMSRRFSEVLPSSSRTDELMTNLSTTSLGTQITDTNWANRLEDFELQSPVGYGSSAVVYSAIYKPLKKQVAIKIIDLDMFERNQIDELRRETALMTLSKHPNVLRVYGSFVNGSKLYIVIPYLSAGSCLDIIKSGFQHGFEEDAIATILKQALEGLVYLHKNGHIHRDVKAGNLLMDDQGTVLLADFGVSSSLAEKGDVRKTFVGTPCWMAPEVMEQAGYDFKADIWSFGITALELAKGHAPFAKFPPMKVLMLTLSNDPPTLDRDSTKHKYSKAFKDMIDCLLYVRPTAERLLHHPFFKQHAKKKEHLVRTILAHVPPLDQRPHKKVPQKPISFESTEQWDFDTPATEDPPAIVPPTRKHISFGNVVIRDAKPEEGKKSRFSVNPETSSTEIAPLPLSRLHSQDSIQERKSRFEVQQQQSSGSESALSRENSNSSGLSLPRNSSTSSKSSRFSVEIENPAGRDHLPEQQPPECRKKGRFELIGEKPPVSTPPTHPHDHVESPLSSLSGSPNTSPYTSLSRDHQSTATAARFLTQTSDPPAIPAIVYTQMEALLKQSDQQRALLLDMMSGIKRGTDESVDHLQQTLANSLRERERLARENESLKRELERLKRQQQ
ncbi:kinase-like domain-containing protein [Fennellomyces sp. T-0311]|nr:kinase-like domain-containing protein [Fennellomyces sp. T-0311]